MKNKMSPTIGENINEKMLEATYGCLFCLAETGVTAALGDAHTLINHISQFHRGGMSELVLQRTNCIIGHSGGRDDWDICIPEWTGS